MSFSETFHGMWFPLFAPSRLKQSETRETFEDCLADAELLLGYAAESGEDVPAALAEPVLAAQAAYKAGNADIHIRAAFYDAYAKLAKRFGEVTAKTIRNCCSSETQRTLRFNRLVAVVLTLLIASVSIATFVADSMSSGIVQDIASANDDAAKLRVALTPLGGAKTLAPIYSKEAPCTLLDQDPPAGSDRGPLNVADIEALQRFAIVLRDLHGRALKLNNLVLRLGMVECDPLGACVTEGHQVPSADDARARTQIRPAITNYPAEVLCKIETYQTIRSFATNVRADYIAMIGGFASFALPIAYAWLGAYAFRLRLFAETIRKRTYEPSFADSARLVTAVIAGAIAALFNPAQGMALSPLATAFLVGYGVELFFKFLDALINAFGSASQRQAG